MVAGGPHWPRQAGQGPGSPGLGGVASGVDVRDHDRVKGGAGSKSGGADIEDWLEADGAM